MATSNHPPSVARVVLAGNPNCGKTSLFNALTGARQKVGNYAGVTVERRSGALSLGSQTVELVDLPGTYSLASYSPEERVAQQELLEHPSDLVVVVADATNLQRSLVLLAQLLHLKRRMILCLNMWDEAERSGQRLNLPLLEQLLGIPVVVTVGHRGQGGEALRKAMEKGLAAPPVESRLVLGEELQHAIDELERVLVEAKWPGAERRWAAVRLLADDPLYAAKVASLGDAAELVRGTVAAEQANIRMRTGLDASLYLTDRHFGFVDGLLREVVESRPREDARRFSDEIDRILVHPIIGGPVFLLVMYAVFWITFEVGAYPMGWIEGGVGALAGWLGTHWPTGAAEALRSLVIDGVIGGVGGVLVFLPNIVLLFLAIAFLEDTGYMARAAFIMDRVMHRFGLHGRSFLPLMTGFGCSVPGIMATRTIESPRDRLTTMLVLPLMSCGARLPIWMLLVPAFFSKEWQAAALWGIYVTGVALALLLALLLRRTILRGEDAPFVMELPPYRLPTLKSSLLRGAERSNLYLRKAGTVILAVSIVMWGLTTYPRATEVEVRAVASELMASRGAGDQALDEAALEAASAPANLRHSLAGRVGRLLEPALVPLGLDWRAGIGVVGAFAAKEVFVAQMAIVHAVGDDDEGTQSLREAIAGEYSMAAGVALILFLLVGTPCMATVAVTRRESGRWGWAIGQFVGLTLLAYLLGVTAYQVLSRLL